MQTISILVGAKSGNIAVFASRDDAEARAAELNADPFLEPGLPDLDAPYTVQTWQVRE
jgi:hypothetical protein